MSGSEPAFVWTRGDTIALAQQSCTYCLGLGLIAARGGKDTVCNCVLRAIFRACYARFRDYASRESYFSRTQAYTTPFDLGSRGACPAPSMRQGPSRRRAQSQQKVEYIADFCLIAKRTLTEYEHAIFKFHFLFGADWKLCCRRLKMDRGTFFHDIYRIQQKLGRTFRELQPYALFPVDEYFDAAPRRSAANRLKRTA